MDRITHQSPRQQGYGSTSSLRNDSLKHKQKHERRREESNQGTKVPGTGGPSGREGRSVRTGTKVPQIVRTGTADRPAWAADCPLKPTEPPVANPEKRTVRGEHADCLPGTRGLSASLCGLSETSSNQSSKTKQIEREAEQEHEEHATNWVEHAPRGRSARHTRTVHALRTEAETARPRRSTHPNHHRISQTVEAVETRVWGHDKRQTRMLYPKNFAS
jgi:hypothetical protein